MPIPSTRARLVSWCLQLLAAGILGQTLFFKLSGAAESRAIFTALSAEPFGRYATAALELAAVVLLVSRRPVLGALLTLALMGGAIASHVEAGVHRREVGAAHQVEAVGDQPGADRQHGGGDQADPVSAPGPHARSPGRAAYLFFAR